MRLPALVATIPLLATPAAALDVVADTPVVHALVSSVLGKEGTATLLLDQGSDPHSFQLRPTQARDLETADIVFWVGEELTPWLGRTLQTVSGGVEDVALLHVPGVRVRELGEEVDEDGHDHGHSHGHDHDHGALDAHAWLDPANAQRWLAAIAAELSERAPEKADIFAANAKTESARIDMMSASIAAKLAPIAGRPIVTFHDAYAYFADAYGVTIAGSIALGDAAAPGAKRLRALQDDIAEGGIACVFREPQHNATIAEAIAEDAGVGIGTLDPSGSTLEPGPGLYRAMMQGLAEEIARCVTEAS